MSSEAIKFINIGFGNIVASSKIIAIVSPDSAPIRRVIQEKDKVIDATCGRRTRAVLFMENGQIILSAVLPETISGRMKETEELSDEK